MAVVIRLARHGRKNSPFYRIVAADKRYSRDGRFLEILGFHNPLARGKAVANKTVINPRLIAWIQKGAKPSDTVATLIKKDAYVNPLLQTLRKDPKADMTSLLKAAEIAYDLRRKQESIPARAQSTSDAPSA
jgi:small subunit ribosomal protein S16